MSTKSDTKEISPVRFKAPIIEIGREGKLKSNQRYSIHKPWKSIEDRGSEHKSTIDPNFRKKKSDFHEIFKNELNDEIITVDLKYFLTFLILLYFVRAVHIMYEIFHKINGKNDIYFETTFEWTMFWAEIAFIIVLFATVIIGYVFCWKMYLSYACPYVISLLLTTFLLGFRLIIQIIYIDDNEVNTRLGYEANKTRETVLDIIMLLMNLIIGFCVPFLYIQISESRRIFKYEPNYIIHDNRLYAKDYLIEFQETVYTTNPESIAKLANSQKILKKSTNK